MSKDNKLSKQIKNLAITKQLNFLIGSGTSYPAIPLMSMVEGKESERNENLVQIIKETSKQLIYMDLSSDVKGDLHKTLKNYVEFISAILNVLNLSNSRQTPRNVNIFTTNYDFFFEKAIDIKSVSDRFILNDGARGYFDRLLDSSNYNRVVSYKGINDNYINEIPSISLIKPHGSINWEKKEINGNSMINVKPDVVGTPVIVKPTGIEGQETFLNNHFHEMLRIFQLELDKPQTVLFTIGFSFQDQHIAKMVRRALQNHELLIYVFAFDESDKNKILENLTWDYYSGIHNLKIIVPSDLGIDENITLKTITEILLSNNMEDENDN